MVGDEAMKAEWTIGKSVASEIVTIVDDGNILGNGFVPFDDEGTEGKENYDYHRWDTYRQTS